MELAEYQTIRVAACDLNGQMRGKRVPGGYARKLDDGAVRMPLSALNLDIFGADIDDSPLVFETGDADGMLRPTGRGPVGMCAVRGLPLRRYVLGTLAPRRLRRNAPSAQKPSAKPRSGNATTRRKERQAGGLEPVRPPKVSSALPARLGGQLKPMVLQCTCLDARWGGSHAGLRVLPPRPLRAPTVQ